MSACDRLCGCPPGLWVTPNMADAGYACRFLAHDADGDWTCSCPVSLCDWTSWAKDEQERAKKERVHRLREHPGAAI